MVQFTLPFPPSSNTIYPTFGKRRVKSKKYLQWSHKANLALNKQKVPIMAQRCWVVYELDSPDKRQRDAANYEKAITDFLVLHDILRGDSYKYLQGVTIYWNDKKGDEVKVTLLEDCGISILRSLGVKK